MKRIFLLLACAALTSSASAQTFYNIDTVQVIQLTFPFTNWDYRMDTANSGSEGYIVATSCVVNGVTFDSVGVKYKGNSSYNANNAKNPLHIDLGYVKDNQDYQGYTDIKLSNGFSDPSFVREVLSYEILRNYMDAPLSNYAKVYINGSYIGLFSSSENIGKKFAGNHFYSKDGTYFKCNPTGGAGPGSSGASDLKYLGTSASSYYSSYELRSDDMAGWTDLIHLCDTLNNFTTSLESIMDVDRAIWMLAFNNVLVNLDSYSGAFRQNYYLYKDDNHRFLPIVWDLNMSFGGFTNLTSGSGGPGVGLDTTGLKNLSISANSTDANHPLIQKIWNNAQWRRMYVAHMKTIAQEMFQSGWYVTRAQQLQAIINADVQADNNKFYSNTQFANSLTTNITGTGGPGGGMGSMGIKNLMNGRLTYLNNTTEFGYTAPTISNIALSNPTPSVFQTINVTANVTNTNNVLLGYRFETPGKFTKVQMYDDGAHGDGASGDGVYGASLALNSAKTEYYIYAENTNAGMFSPQRAEHEFYTINAGVTPVATGTVVINEFVADNETGVTDASGKQEDWIELYNNSTNPISLKGLYLSDNATNATKWAFPDYAVLPASGFVTVWCDEDNGESGFHGNFKNSNTGGKVMLSYSTNVIDSNTYAAQAADESVARCANGSGAFTNHIAPTFGSVNTCLNVGINDLSNNEMTVYPNPTTDAFYFTLPSDARIGRIEVMNAMGQTMTVVLPNASKRIETSTWAVGLYVVSFVDESGRRRNVKLIKQ